MVRGRIETRGSVLLGAAVALAAAGLLRVDGVLLALGAAAGILLIIAWGMGRLNLAGLRVQLDAPGVVSAGVPVRFRVAVLSDRRLLDGFGLLLELDVPGGLKVAGRVPWVPAGSGADLDYREVIPDRGRSKVVACRLVSVFPLGLWRFERTNELGVPMVVLPRPMVPVELLAAGSASDAAPQMSSAASESMGEPRGLRSYRAGDPVKAIAWAATLRSQARGGEVLVRELDPPGFHPQRAVIVFHSFGMDGALIRPDRFERAISLAWGAMRHFLSQGVPVTLLADFEEWVPRQVGNRRQLGGVGRLLSGAVRAGGTELHELQGRLADIEPSDGVIVVSDMPLGSWESKLQARERQVTVDVARYEGSRGIGRRGANA